MSDMKCPFCNGELIGTIGHPICRNQDCVMCDDPMPQDLLEKLIRTRKALDKGMEHIAGLNNMIESWYKLLQSDKDTSTKYAILKSAISAYVENKGGSNE